MAQHIARLATLSLDFIYEDEVDASTTGFAERIAPIESSIQNYGGFDFVDNGNEWGCYYIPGYSVEPAVEFFESAQE